MAVDLFCYAAEVPEAVEKKMAQLAECHHELFPKKFLISKVLVANALHKEIAREYGGAAESLFIVSLNDKSAADLMEGVVGIIKSYLGMHRVIVLNGNEVLM